MVNQIYQDFGKISIHQPKKYPEILFTGFQRLCIPRKRKSNTFDGFIGFSNNETNKIRLNGYADIKLENILGSELLSIYWKSDGNDQKTFNAIELPYILKSPLGLKLKFNYLDKTYLSEYKTAIDLSYFANYNTRYYLRIPKNNFK
jgi:hypothetical protein